MQTKVETLEDLYQLSPLQQGMLFHSLYAQHSGVDIEQMICTLHENVNVLAFKQAWQRVVERHPVLRTSFHWQGDNEPLQYVHRQVRLSLKQHDWCGLSALEQSKQLLVYLRVDRRQGFDLTQPPLMRLALFRLGKSHYQFVWTFHHALLDGRSIPLVLKEVIGFYDTFCQGEDLQLPQPPSYRDYIQWQKQQDLSRAEKFWRQLLLGFTAPTRLVVEQSPRMSENQDESCFAGQEIRLPIASTKMLRALAQQHQLTLNTLVQGAWALLLSRYSGETDIVFGATRACRHSSVAGVESMVGLLINTLPIRVDVPPQQALLPWLKQLRAAWIALREYEHTALSKIYEWSELPGGMPLFNSILVFENYYLNSMLQAQGGRWSNIGVQLLEQTNYPLTLAGYLDLELILKLSYDRRRFDDATIARMLGHIKTLLEGMAADPEQRLSQLPMLTVQERHQILVEWNNTKVDLPKQVCMHQLFEAQVELTPDAVAVVFKNEQLTYRELNHRANQLAYYLQALGVGPEVLVGICMERSLEMVVGLVGILKAGGAYVPLDPTYPKERLKFMLQDAQVPVLLLQQQLVETLPEHEAHLVCLDPGREVIPQASTANLESRVTPDNLAYVIYTSGSTGQPKGVMIPHQAICHQILCRQIAFHLTSSDRVLQITSLSFDPSVWQIFGTLVAGAQLILAPPGAHQDSAELVRLIAEYQITILDLVPSILKLLLEEEFLPETCKSLKHVFCGGEALPVEVYNRFFARLEANLSNQYGPTEATIDSTSWTVERASQHQIVPIGRPLANKQVYLLDSPLQLVPIGVPGELHIGGGLARGYLNRPELTALKFIPNPFSNEPGTRLYKTGDLARYLPDGNIEFLGRIDNQTKIRGFRIEVGEIEAQLRQHPAVQETLVMVREDIPGDKRIVAYVVLHHELSGSGGSELRSFLKKKLPDYMLPSAFVLLDAIPLTPNGKVDRQALPVPEQASFGLKSFVAPTNPLEHQLTQIWEEILDIQPIGIQDNFFELGGHSLLAVRLMHQIEQVCGQKLPVSTLFTESTVEHLANFIVQQDQRDFGSPLVEIQSGGNKRPFFFLHGDFHGGGLYCLNLARYLGKEQPFYALPPHEFDSTQMPPTIETMAADRLETLRAFQPEGPYLLGGYCNGGIVAFEMARQLQARGQKVDLLVLIEASASNTRFQFLYSCVSSFGHILGLKPEQQLDCFLYWRDHLIDLQDFTRLRIEQQLILVLRKVKGRIKQLVSTFKPKTGEQQSGALKEQQDITNNFFLFEKALNGYTPRKYPGRVTLFRASELPIEHFDDPTIGWREVAQEVDVHLIPGDHLTCITRHVEVLAAKLRFCFREAQLDKQVP